MIMLDKIFEELPLHKSLIAGICMDNYNLMRKSNIDYFNISFADGVIEEVDLTEKLYWIREFVLCTMQLMEQ